MSGSLEDLRELYKNSRQSKLNHSKNKRDQKSYTSSIIRVHSTVSKPQKDLAETAHKFVINKSDVDYSLNKKKRWEIKEDLVTRMNDFETENIDVRLYEIVNSYNRNDLIEAYKSKGQDLKNNNRRSFLSVRAQEADEARQRNIPKPQIKIKKPNRFKPVNMKQKKKKTDVDIERIVIEPSEDEAEEVYSGRVEYTIQHEIAKKNFRSYSSDIITAQRYRKVPTVDQDDLYWSESEEEQISVDDKIENNDEYFGYSEFESSLNTSKHVDFDELVQKFAVYLVEKQKLNELKNAKEISSRCNIHSKPSDLLPKNQIIYIEDHSTKTKLFKASNQSSRYCEAKPVMLKLQEDSLNAKNLTEKFGSNINEAYHSSPRHFNIDMTEDLKQQFPDYEIFGWIRFRQAGQFYHVSICANLNCESISIENINPTEIYTVETVYSKALEMIRCLPYESFHKKSITSSSIIKATYSDKQFIDSFKMMMKRQESVDMTKLRNKLLNKQGEQEFENKSEEFEDSCVLCFDEKKNLEECVLIKTCGHKICTDCMRDYVDSRLTNALRNAGKLPCPCCDQEIELALMVSYASNAVLLDTFLRVSVERFFFNSESYKWCPSPGCDKILKVDRETNPFGVAICRCGFKMCLMCNQEPHFPAKCSQVSNYHKELQKNGDEKPKKETDYYVSNGKRCPQCQTYMEKNNGCNHMSCSVCKKEFCWFCLKSWEDHMNGSIECKQTEDYKKIEVEFKGKKKAKSTNIEKEFRYSSSINHRLNRTKKINDEKMCLAKSLLKTLEYNDLAEYQEHEKFLKEIVAFLAEMHFICEYGYVSMWEQKNTEFKLRVSYAIKGIELVIFLIGQVFTYEKGYSALDKLRVLMNRGVKYLKLLQLIQK